MNLTSIAALVASFGPFFTGGAAWLSAKQSKKVEKELTPNSGSSMKDQINLLVDMVKSQGHQIGEIKREALATHEQYARRLEKIEEKLLK